MGCASGKKVSRCSAAKDITSDIPMQDSIDKPLTPVPQELPEAAQGISLAPVAALLAKGGEEPRKPAKPALPPAKKPLAESRDLPKPLGESAVQMRKGSEGENAPQARKGAEDEERNTHKRKNSADAQTAKKVEDPQKDLQRMPISPSEPMLPIAKNISGVKTTFDKGKFKQVNASGPVTLEERLEEIPLFTGSIEKPLSTLTLPTKQKPNEGTGSTVVSNL